MDVKGEKHGKKESIVLQNCCNCRDESRNKLTFFLTKQSLKALLCSRIESRSIRVVNDEGWLCYLTADEPRWIDSAATMCHE